MSLLETMTVSECTTRHKGTMVQHKEVLDSVGLSEDLSREQEWERVAKEADFKPRNMAVLCAVSERHLQRIFRKYFHSTPSNWLRKLQCRLAKDLIMRGYSSKAAAAEVKFATDAHFCREFKKAFGAPPQNFSPHHMGYFALSALKSSSAPASACRAVH